MKTPLAIWIQRLVAVFVIILVSGLLVAAHLREQKTPPPKVEQVCDVCDDYESKKNILKEQFRALKETHNRLDLQAEKEGLLHHTLRSDGHIDSSAPGGMGHIETLIYWDKKGKLSYVELDLQQLQVDLSVDNLNHAILHAAERLESK